MMNGLKLCCDGLKAMIDAGNVRLDYSMMRVDMHGSKIVKCPKCGNPFEWVENGN